MPFFPQKLKKKKPQLKPLAEARSWPLSGPYLLSIHQNLNCCYVSPAAALDVSQLCKQMIMKLLLCCHRADSVNTS